MGDRTLTTAQLSAVSGLTPAALTPALHALDEQWLITATADDLRLRHPLLAEAVRRRLVLGEAREEHRRLALVLADSLQASAAEVAEHWRRADDPEKEVAWRIRAAQEAGSRFAHTEEAEQWRRALDLWPDDAEFAGSSEVRKVEAYFAAIDALNNVDWRRRTGWPTRRCGPCRTPTTAWEPSTAAPGTSAAPWATRRRAWNSENARCSSSTPTGNRPGTSGPCTAAATCSTRSAASRRA